ncbi:zinc ribbon domain-containing protein [Nocardioides dubius]|uniref:zinc ribbon domain-containing protein n=1 Tax=Nocardioides dubius TaxID=317019 RepID=UPI0039ECCCEC
MSTCPHCGAAVTPGAAFCGSCGQSLAAAPAAPEATQVRPSTPPADPTAAVTAQAPTPPAQPTPPAPQQWGSPAQPEQPPAQQWQQQPPAQQGWQQPPPAPAAQQQWGQQAQQPGQGQWGQQAPQGQQWAPPAGGAYAAPGQGFGGPGKPSFDFSKILAGNWLGMATVVGAALGVALVVNLIIAFTTAEDLKVGSAIAMALLLTGATFGPNIIYDLGNDDYDYDQTASLGQYPLLATVLALGVAIYLFRRVTARYPDVRTALIDAVRAGVLMMLSLLVLAIVLRIWSPEIKGYASTDGSDGTQVGPAGLGLQDGEAHLSIPGAIFLGFLLLTAVLALTCFVRPDWLTGVWAKVHAWVAAPLIGIAAVAVATTAAGLLYLIAIIAGNDDARGFSEVMALVAVLPALGVRMLALGVFANVGFDSDGDDELSQGKSLDRLGDFADDNGVLFWIAPLVAIAIAAAGAYVVIWKSLDRTKILRNVAVYLGLLLVAVPFLVRFANAHLNFKVEADDETYKGSFWLGVSGFGTTGLFFLLSIVVAAVLLVVTGNLDVNAVKAKAQAAAQQAQAQMQQNQQQWGQQPGQGQQQPGQQQWGAPPPQQQWGQQPPPPPQQAPGQWGQQPPQQPGQWGQQPPAGGQPPQAPGPQNPQQWGQPGQGGQPPQH